MFVSLYPVISLYICILKEYVCTKHITMLMFLFRSIHISIYFYLDITGGISKSWRTKHWLPSVLQTQPECLGNALMYWVAAASSHPSTSRGCLGSCRCSQGSQQGWHWWKQQDRSRTGTGVGRNWCALTVRSPVMAQVSPAATQPSQGGQGWGEKGRLGSPIKFYTSLHCFSGCFQNQKIQEIYSQMFPCLFVDSV